MESFRPIMEGGHSEQRKITKLLEPVCICMVTQVKYCISYIILKKFCLISQCLRNASGRTSFSGSSLLTHAEYWTDYVLRLGTKYMNSKGFLSFSFFRRFYSLVWQRKNTSRGSRRGKSRLPAEQGVRCGAQPQNPGIRSWAEDRHSTTESPRHPNNLRFFSCFFFSHIQRIHFPSSCGPVWATGSASSGDSSYLWTAILLWRWVGHLTLQGLISISVLQWKSTVVK